MVRAGARRRLLAGMCGLLGASWGCGPAVSPMSAEASELSRLNEVGEIYRVHQVIVGRPPKSMKDLMAVANSSPSGFEALKSGQVVARWGATLPDTAEGPGKGDAAEVLAYTKEVPEKGGPVLFLDRSVRPMTAEAFKAAPKAGSP